MFDLSKDSKTEAIAFLVSLFTGSRPIINRTAEYNEIEFTPEQVKLLQDQLKRWHDKEPGAVRVKVGPVLAPFYLKKYSPYLLGGIAAGALLGRLIK